MQFAFPQKWKSSSKLASKAAAQAVADNECTGNECKGGGANDDGASIGSSLSSLSSSSDKADVHSLQRRAPTFENGTLVKAVDESVLLKQAEESLRTALLLVDEAQNELGSWVDARDLLDVTAAALDDAGLALRRSRTETATATPSTTSLDGSSSQTSVSGRSNKSGKTKSSKGSSAGSGDDDDGIPKEDVLVRKLADEVVDKRKALLGNVLVHDADGIWAKSVYGKGDGISFGSAVGDFLPLAVPDKEKDDRALIVWASQTGTAKKFAKNLHKHLGGGSRSVLKSLRETSIREFARYRRVYVVCSTFGIGRPPSEGELFYSSLQLEALRCSENFDDLDEGGEECKPFQGTSVSIAALGSSAFRDFAKFGFGLAKELAAMGATMALEVTTLDAAKGTSNQKKAFRTWEKSIVEMEKERLAGFAPKIMPSMTPKAA